MYDLEDLITQRKLKELGEKLAAYIQTSTGPVVTLKLPRLPNGEQTYALPHMLGGLVQIYEYEGVVMEIKNKEGTIITVKMEPFDSADEEQFFLREVAEVYPAVEELGELN